MPHAVHTTKLLTRKNNTNASSDAPMTRGMETVVSSTIRLLLSILFMNWPLLCWPSFHLSQGVLPINSAPPVTTARAARPQLRPLGPGRRPSTTEPGGLLRHKRNRSSGLSSQDFLPPLKSRLNQMISKADNVNANYWHHRYRLPRRGPDWPEPELLSSLKDPTSF